MCYKLYVRRHLAYGDINYHNEKVDLMKLVEHIQYKKGLIVSGCWQDTNRDKLYEELVWESLSGQRWFYRLNLFKNFNGLIYLTNYLHAVKQKCPFVEHAP